MHKSVRAIIEKDGGIILIHRVKPNDDGTYRDYYVVPGGKMEEGENEEQTVTREVIEELGITIKPQEKILEYHSDYDNSIQTFYLCNFIDGTIGTGTGPEMTDKVNYKGTYEPLIVKFNDIKNINLVPEQIKKLLIDKYI